ncbi:MAG: VOC family protein [Nitriliruptorales bacterium]|nr:VOC family protein [Nitriliruptorales bacterium]
MVSRLVALCVEAVDPIRVARFWAAVLQWDVDQASRHGDSHDAVGVVSPDRKTIRMLFLPVQARKANKNAIHLDLSSSSLDDQSEAVAKFIERGAQHIDVGQRPEESHVVLADPEGNEFCVLEPGNSFVDNRSRFGSITCDGSPEVGHFWSAALGWPLVWDQDGETAIRASDATGPFITWGGPTPTSDMPRRWHFDITPLDGGQEAEVERLISLGAIPVKTAGGDPARVVLADPDQNPFCVVRSSDHRLW